MRLQLTANWIDNWHFKLSCQWDAEGQQYMLDNLTWVVSEFGPEAKLPSGKWKMGYVDKKKRLFYKETIKPCYGEFLFLRGFAPYVCYHFGQWMDDTNVLSNINPEYEELHFDGLYEWQNADLNQLTKFKGGLFSTKPSYGKSQVLATYMQYLLDKGKNVLVATPSSKSLEELMSRYCKLNNKELKPFKKLDISRPLNFVNVNGFTRQKLFSEIPQSWFDSIDVLLLDEAEYNTAKGAQDLFFKLNNVKQVYAFSATADAKRGGIVSVKDGIGGSVRDNVEVAGLLGFTLVYNKAQGYDITIHEVSTNCFTAAWFQNLKDRAEAEELGEESGTFQELMQDLYKNDKFCALMEGIARKGGCMFVPINQLQILDYWNEHTLLLVGEQTCIISSRGIELFTADGLGSKTLKQISLDELKEMVKSGTSNIKLIYGTKSAFNSVDLPGLSSVMPISNKMASSVIQYVGRAARGSHFDVYLPIPMERRCCPIIWKDSLAREELITNYYSECKISKLIETEAMYIQN